MRTFVLLRSGHVAPVDVSSHLSPLVALIPKGFLEVFYKASDIAHKEVIGKWLGEDEVTYRIVVYFNV